VEAMDSARMNGEGQAAKLLIVDSEPLAALGAAAYCEQCPTIGVCAVASSAAQACRIVALHQPDVLLVDLDLECGDALALLKELSGACPRSRSVILGRHQDAAVVQRVLSSGVRGYIHRRDAPEDVLRGIARVVDGKIHVSKRVADTLLGRIFAGAGKGGEAERMAENCLPPRQWEVFRRLGAGRSIAGIAEEMGISVRTVETHCSRISAALDLSGMAALREYAIAAGMRG